MSDVSDDPEARRWNHHPGRVRLNPLFAWPPDPLGVLRWYADIWLTLTTLTLSAVMALMAYHLWLGANPGLLPLFLSLLVPHALLAGGLHLWLIGLRGQAKSLKYDPRGQARNNGTYTFGSQTLDNAFWSLASGIPVATAYAALCLWAISSGWAPTTSFVADPLWFLALFIVIPLWGSFHFYWGHRLLHWPPLYRVSHALHHRNVNVGPWSGISMHPIEHGLYFSSLLIHLVLPTHPIHVLFHVYSFTLHPICSHSGFDALLVRGRRTAQLGDFFHQLHHRYFECNYGTSEMPWDRWFGTFHDGSSEATMTTRARKTRMHP